MAVTLNNNAIYSTTDDLAFVKKNLGIPAAETRYDDDLKTIINQVSDRIEAMLKVESRGIEYRGVIRQQTFTDFIFTGSGNQNCYIPIYPIISVSSLEYTTDYTTWLPYPAPHVVLTKYKIHLPNSCFSKRPMATKITGIFGYANIPGDISNVAFEMIQDKVNQGKLKDLGKNRLGVKSENIGSQATSSASFERLDDKWLNDIKPYIRPEFAYQTD